MIRVLLALCALALLAGCGDENEQRPASAPPAATAAATATPTAAATPDAQLDQALWPAPDDAMADPVAAAHSFVAEYIGVEDPQLGEFREGEPRVGEIEVFRRGEDGSRLDTVVSTLSLRQLDGENWFVTSAQSGEVEITAPEPLTRISSPVEIEGRGRGFEGNVVLEVRAAFAIEPLVQEPVIAGAMEELRPFSADLTFEAPDAETGAIVAKTGSGISAADGFAAFAVRF